MIGWAIEMLIATTLLMIAVLALRGPIRRAFGSVVAYALWLMPAARLMLPQLPGDWRLSRLLIPLVHGADATPGMVVGIIDPAMLPPDLAARATIAAAALGRHHAAVALVPPSMTDRGPGIAMLALALWIGGAAAFFGYHVVGHALFCRRVLRHGSVAAAAGRVRVIESDAAPTPLAFGIARRYVALPRDFTNRYAADERALALRHELGHHRHGDLLANWAALGVLALHWFNPIAWRAFRAFCADQEMANDMRVLAGRSPIERHAYASAIVKAAHPGFSGIAATCHLNTVRDLKGRLKMLNTLPVPHRRFGSGGAVVASLLVVGLVLTASGSSAAAIGEKVRQAIVAPPPPLSSSPPTPPVVETPKAAQTPSFAKHREIFPAVARDNENHTYYRADVHSRIETGKAVSVAPLGPDSLRMIAQMPDDPDTRVEVQDVPSIESAKCGIGSGKPVSMMVQNENGPRRLIVICTDRIQRLAADAAARAGNATDIERTAYAQALAGLLEARTKMAADAGVTDAERAHALSAIDTSIAEMRSQVARAH